MGLDMSLYKVHEVCEKEMTSHGNRYVTHKREEEIGYWRKFNALHAYIVAHYAEEDNCQPIVLMKHEVEEVLEMLKNVNANHEVASKILPTQSGFFFGGTEYDTNYFRQVEASIGIFTEALEETEWDGDGYVVYQASW